jgi:TP901 family phage tail tape measure protein
VKFVLEDAEFKKSLANIGSQLKAVGKIGSAVTAPIVAGFTACVAQFAAAGAHLDDLAKQTGLSGGALSELGYAAEQSGTNVDTLAKGVLRMERNISAANEGTGTFGKTLQDLGLNIDAIAKMTPEEQFTAIADAISRIPDPADKAAKAQRAFGGASKDLLPLLEDGAEGMAKLRQEAIDLGIAMSNDQVTAAGELDDAWSRLKQTVFGLSKEIGGTLADDLTYYLGVATNIVAKTTKWIQDNPELVRTIAKVTTAIGAASLATLGLGLAIGIVSAHPIVALLTLVAGAVAYIVFAFDNLRDRLLAVMALFVPFGNAFKTGLEGFEEATGVKLIPEGPELKFKMPGGLDDIKAQSEELQATIQTQMETSLEATRPATGFRSEAAATAELESLNIKDITRTADGVADLVKIQEQVLGILRNSRGGIRVGSG